MKGLPLAVRIVLLALIVGVFVPYISYKLRSSDGCMPEEAGMFYIPVLVPLFERCPISFVGEFGLVTIGLPALVIGIGLEFLTGFTLLGLSTDLFCVVPLLFSFLFYVALAVMLRWLLKA